MGDRCEHGTVISFVDCTDCTAEECETLKVENETIMRERERIGNLCGEKSVEIETLRAEVGRLKRDKDAHRSASHNSRLRAEQAEQAMHEMEHERNQAERERDEAASGAESLYGKVCSLESKIQTLTATLARYEKALEAGDRLERQAWHMAARHQEHKYGSTLVSDLFKRCEKYVKARAAAREGGGRDE